MRIMSQSTGVFLSAATAIAALGGLPGVAFAAEGGTITFHGGIGAPQFLVSAMSRSTTGRSTVAYDSSTTIVSFGAPPGVVSGADVKLQVNDGSTSSTDAAALTKVSARFVDGNSHTLSSTNGHYRLPQSGGSLSLGQKSGAAPSAKEQVTVVVSYD